ncbi:hypothetical protein MGSAQ_002644 [marine sediment metagenome]|uniref:Uncharacterized protein n=1 Tax=marine sediment metagenome TaxID=412755 RepID=A0A1B6NQZ6_9ZZZZ
MCRTEETLSRSTLYFFARGVLSSFSFIKAFKGVVVTPIF